MTCRMFKRKSYYVLLQGAIYGVHSLRNVPNIRLSLSVCVFVFACVERSPVYQGLCPLDDHRRDIMQGTDSWNRVNQVPNMLCFRLQRMCLYAVVR